MLPPQREHGAERRPHVPPIYCTSSPHAPGAETAPRTVRDHVAPYTSPRHTPITNVHRAPKALSPPRRSARTPTPPTPTAYTHPTDEELYEGIRRLRA